MTRPAARMGIRLSTTSRDWLAPPAPTTAWQRERMQRPRGKVRSALRRGTLADVAAVLGFGVAVCAMVLAGAWL